MITRQRKASILSAFWRSTASLLFLILLIILFTAYNPRFLSPRNITNILTEVSIYGIIGVGMTYVILTGGIDLAVGSLLAFSAMCGAYIVQRVGRRLLHELVRGSVRRLCGRDGGRLPAGQGDHEVQRSTLHRDSRWHDGLARSHADPQRWRVRSAASTQVIAGGDAAISWAFRCRFWSSSSSPWPVSSPCATRVMAVRSMPSAATRKRRACPA